jgi:hypothetical protein
MGVKVWSKVAVALQSALAAAVSASAISKANPGVLTHAGASPTNGDYVLLKVQGMTQVDFRVVRVAGATATTFQLEGVDTTLFDTFSSGTFEKITFGTSITSATDFTTSGGDFDQIDVTTIHDAIKKQIPGSANALTVNGNLLWDPAEAAQIALKASSDTKSQLAVRITFADNTRALFVGYVGFSGVPTGQAQGRVDTPLTITAFGLPTYYAT